MCRPLQRSARSHTIEQTELRLLGAGEKVRALHKRPTTIHVTRDSVCAGDDCRAPHEACYTVQRALTVSALIARLVLERYFPYIAGGMVTWVMQYAGRPIVVVGFMNYPDDGTRRVARFLGEDITLSR